MIAEPLAGAMTGYGTYEQLQTLTYAGLQDGYWYQGLEVLGPDVPCAPTPWFGGPVTADNWTTVFFARSPVPHDWYYAEYHWRYLAGNMSDPWDGKVLWVDKNLQPLMDMRSCFINPTDNPGTKFDTGFEAGWVPDGKTRVRFLELHARAYSGSMITATLELEVYRYDGCPGVVTRYPPRLATIVG